MMSELLTADELAGRLRVKASTIKKWTRAGWLPAVRVSPKVVRFDLVEVDRALRERATKQQGVDHAE
jgi:excisionase family DNA binding protein